MRCWCRVVPIFGVEVKHVEDLDSLFPLEKRWYFFEIKDFNR